jgi:hypothetical protein
MNLVDSSAWLAYFADEPTADSKQRRLGNKKSLKLRPAVGLAARERCILAVKGSIIDIIF